MIKDTRIEPGLLSLFRLISGLWLVGPTIALFTGGTDPGASGSPGRLYRLLIPAFLLLYLYCGRLQGRLGGWYLPVAMLAASGGPILLHWRDMTWFLHQGGSSELALSTQASAYSLFFPLFITMIFIGVQYGFPAALVFTLGTAALQVLLAKSLFPGLEISWSNAFADLSRQAVITDLTPLDIIARTLLERVPLFLVTGFLVARISQSQKTDRRMLAEKNLELARYATTVEQLTASHERNRMARELHDTLAHTLSAVSVQLEALNAQLESDTTGAKETLTKTRALMRNGLQEVRRALTALRASPVEDLGLALAFHRLVEAMAERTGVKIALEMTYELEGLRPEVEQSLYRIAEEALNNAARHANAQTITVSLGRGQGELQLTITDDGVGFDPQAVPGEGQYGLLGMRERAMLCNGQLEIDSKPGQGTTLRFSVAE